MAPTTISPDRILDLIAAHGHVPLRGQIATGAFRDSHPDWDEVVVNGEHRFTPAVSAQSSAATGTPPPEFKRSASHSAPQPAPPQPAPPQPQPQPPATPPPATPPPATPPPATPPPASGSGASGGNNRDARAPILVSASRYQIVVGETVRISGRNLASPKSVTVGGTPVIVLQSKNSEVFVQIPALPTGEAPHGVVEVTNAHGKGRLGRPFTASVPPPSAQNNGAGAGPGGAPAPTPASPSQAGTNAAGAHQVAYDAAKTAAESAFNAAGGSGVMGAATAAAYAAARQAAGPGQSAAARQAAAAVVAQARASAAGGGAGGSGGAGAPGASGGAGGDSDIRDLIATLGQWMQIVPAPLRILASAATSIAHAAGKSGISFPAANGPAGQLYGMFKTSMNAAAKAVAQTAPVGPPSPPPGWAQAGSKFFGSQIGTFAGKLGMVDSAGVVPPAVAGAISGAMALMISASFQNVSKAAENGRAASLSFTNGIRSGFGEVSQAAQDLTRRITDTLLAPFGKSGAGISGFIGQNIASVSSTADKIVGYGSDLRATMNGWKTGTAAVGAGAVGAGIGAVLGFGVPGAIIGGLIGTLLGVVGSGINKFFTDISSKVYEMGGKLVGEVLKIAGSAVEAFTKVLGDATEAALAYANAARSIANRSGMSDGAAGKFLAVNSLLGMSSQQTQGMFSGVGDMQVFRSMRGAPFGLQGMPMSGEADALSYVKSIREQSKSWESMGGPMFGKMMQRTMLDASGNGGYIDAVGLSDKAFNDRVGFAQKFPMPGGASIGAFNDDIGTLMSQWDYFVNWLKVAFGEKLIPFIQAMFNGLVGFVVTNKDAILSTILGAAEWVYAELPRIGLTMARGMLSGVSMVMGVLGQFFTFLGSNAPALFQVLEKLVNSFRDILAMGAGYAKAASGPWYNFMGNYNSGKDEFLKAVPKFDVNKLISPKQQILAGQQMTAAGNFLGNLSGSINGTKTVSPLTDGALKKLDGLINDADPAVRHKAFAGLIDAVNSNTTALQKPAQMNLHLTQEVTPRSSFFAQVTGAMLEADHRDLARQGI